MMPPFHLQAFLFQLQAELFRCRILFRLPHIFSCQQKVFFLNLQFFASHHLVFFCLQGVYLLPLLVPFLKLQSRQVPFGIFPYLHLIFFFQNLIHFLHLQVFSCLLLTYRSHLQVLFRHGQFPQMPCKVCLYFLKFQTLHHFFLYCTCLCLLCSPFCPCLNPFFLLQVYP